MGLNTVQAVTGGGREKRLKEMLRDWNILESVSHLAIR